MNISVYFHDISSQYFLERLSLIFVCRESEGDNDDVALVEPARRQVAQHGAHILVFERLALQASVGRAGAAQLAKHDVALHQAARLLFA